MEAYSSYLQKSKSLKYKEEAEKAMLELKAAAEWEKCKQTDSENVLSGFISRYPTSKYADKALYRYNIMVGERYYSSSDESLAEYYLENAAKIKALTGKPAAHLKEIKGAAEFRRIMSSTSLNEVALYLKTLSPGSRYYDRISNRLAVLKADNLDASSSDYSMQDALSYATDEATRSYVNDAIRTAKSNRAYYAREIRLAARKTWWKDWFNVGWNIAHVDYMSPFASVGTGLKFRFGRWDDVLNFTLGVEYSYQMNIGDEYYDYSEKVANQMDIPLGVRFNLFRVIDNYKLYVGCDAIWGFTVGDSDYDWNLSKNNMSLAPQIGMESDKFDFGLYYRYYLDSKPFLKYSTAKYNQRIGLFATWYF